MKTARRRVARTAGEPLEVVCQRLMRRPNEGRHGDQSTVVVKLLVLYHNLNAIANIASEPVSGPRWKTRGYQLTAIM